MVVSETTPPCGRPVPVAAGGLPTVAASALPPAPVADHNRVLAALLAFFLARLLPPMPAILAVLARGLSVVAVMSVALWLTGFFSAAELRWLNALRQQRGRGAPLTTAPDATEMAGEVVSVDVPDEMIEPRSKGPRP